MKISIKNIFLNLVKLMLRMHTLNAKLKIFTLKCINPILKIPTSYWYTYSTPKYGNCFTFNTLENIGNDDNIPRLASLTGRDNGEFVKRLLNVIMSLKNVFSISWNESRVNYLMISCLT